MFSFCKPSKTKILNCYTHYTNGIHNLFPPARPKNPEWFKKLQVYSDLEIARQMLESQPEISTNLRYCPGRNSLYEKGFMIVMWSDLYLKIGPKGTNTYAYQFADRRSIIAVHGEDQYRGLVKEDSYCHLKIVSPWHIHSEKKLEVLAIKPAWEVESLHGIEILPGVMDFSLVHQTNINMFIKREKEEKEILIKAGTPIYHFVPLGGVNIKLNVQYSPSDSIERLKTTRGPRVNFVSSYNKVKRRISDNISKK